MTDEPLGTLRRLLRSLGVPTRVVDDVLTQVGAPRVAPDDDTPVYAISAAAELAGMHPQTLRQYDRLGLVTPRRTKGRGRRYSAHDIRMLREISRLSHDEGINLAGISRIIELERANEALSREVQGLRAVLTHLSELRNRRFAADPTGGVTEYSHGQRPAPRPNALVRYQARSQALVLWRGDD
ncbi:MAG: helix-turn-helix transcriptional regulator [Actinomycetaceae bacterium]|nr:helix-turn-helix transcriptional regulator [Actinomycetaceae bacterium]MDU0969820.1 helix-turn-helix transcriptional regulator [Actinomycetaceae bacterium]